MRAQASKGGHVVRCTVIALAAVGFLAATSTAAERTILGKTFIVKAKPPDPTKRTVKGNGSEKNSPDPLVGNPTSTTGSAGGAILDVRANGGNSTAQRFNLPQGLNLKGKPFWTGDATKGFKYKDSKGEQGPVKKASIKRSPKGTFTIKMLITGKNGTVNVVPPNPGTDGCFALDLGIDPLAAGDRYSVFFGPESKITNKGDTLFKASKPTLEAICPPVGPTPTTSTSTSTTMTTSTSSTTSTTIYGSPSKAFLLRSSGLLD
jgi:hypothetical protein